MEIEALFLILCSLLAVLFFWVIKQNTWEILAIWSLFALLLVSPLSALWLGSVSLVVSMALLIGDAYGYKNYLTLGVSILLTGLFLYLRELHQFLWVGSAYFTLRNLHVLFDWWMGKLISPSITTHLRYQLFLPALMAGLINRFQVFERQIARRRWDASDFFTGLERLLFGMAQVIILGGWLVSQVSARIPQSSFNSQFATQNFFISWLSSAVEWVELYFVFVRL